MTTGPGKALLAEDSVRAVSPQLDYRPFTDAIRAATGFIGDAGSVKVISSHGASSPWWAGQVVEVSPHEKTFGGMGVVVSSPKEPLQAAGALPMKLPSFTRVGHAPEDRAQPAPEGVSRCFSVSFGKDVFGTAKNIGLALPLAAITCVSVGPAIQTHVFPARDEPAAVVEVVGRTVSLDSEPQEWVDTDDEPTWLLMETLPYHGGGVMGRRRHEQ
ncbi:MAG: hypothetical protein ACR2LK_02505 [Solirubrobacteraceae bacterium]